MDGPLSRLELGLDLVGSAASATLAATIAEWASSGAMALTGRRSGPALLHPAPAATAMARLAALFSDRSARLGRRVDVDGPALLGERAAVAGHTRQGDVSCGGTCRLWRAADGWVALSLARDEDIELIPAWLEREVDAGRDAALAAAISARSAAALSERAGWLGLPCAALGEATTGTLPAYELGTADAIASLDGLVVVDLSSLWAGPLCTQLLAAAGATVVKVESTSRPDGARRGPKRFFDLMHAGKESVGIDLATHRGHAALAGLLDRADVVVEASRPRALEQMGIDAAGLVSTGRARVWLSITAHGRFAQPMRVGFGDDAAVAGRLVAWDAKGLVFAADAIADPITGLATAVAVLDRLAAGGRWMIDAGLAPLARLAIGAAAPIEPDARWHGTVSAPRARPLSGPAPRLGQHNDRWLSSQAVR
jgi:hypothetical protein